MITVHIVAVHFVKHTYRSALQIHQIQVAFRMPDREVPVIELRKHQISSVGRNTRKRNGTTESRRLIDTFKIVQAFLFFVETNAIQVVPNTVERHSLSIRCRTTKIKRRSVGRPSRKSLHIVPRINERVGEHPSGLRIVKYQIGIKVGHFNRFLARSVKELLYLIHRKSDVTSLRMPDRIRRPVFIPFRFEVHLLGLSVTTDQRPSLFSAYMQHHRRR